MEGKIDTISQAERSELIRKLQIYYEHMPQPRHSNRKSEMLICSYKRWVMLNLSEYILSHLKDDLPEDAVRDYMTEMAKYETMCKMKPNMFACAFSVANDIWVRMVNETL